MNTKIAKPNIPIHVAIVMDGNGRWAEKRNLPKSDGHLAGVESARKIIQHSIKRGIKYLSLFALSSENLNRPAKEVEYLMQLYIDVLESDSDILHKQNISLKFIGDRRCFSKQLQASMSSVEKKTAINDTLTLIIALNYGGKWDIAQAAKRLFEDYISGKVEPADIAADLFNSYLSTASNPDPDLYIRPSGVSRISNFYLWQLAYSELFFSDVLWPDFDAKEYDKALDIFANRLRNFGLRHE